MKTIRFITPNMDGTSSGLYLAKAIYDVNNSALFSVTKVNDPDFLQATPLYFIAVFTRKFGVNNEPRPVKVSMARSGNTFIFVYHDINVADPAANTNNLGADRILDYASDQYVYGKLTFDTITCFDFVNKPNPT